jgi:2-keto-4-pentenoate hydratase/2-oxohepta-3-ene-1,7-dioic acid hydratase in catechol pathway
MKLITFASGPQARPGLAFDGVLGLDLLAADPSLPDNWHALYSEMARVRRLYDQLAVRTEALIQAPPAEIRLPFVDLTAVRLLPPVVLPSKIIAVGLNYRDHAAEQDKPLPEAPLLFSKAPSCLQAHGGPIGLTEDLVQVDAEAELAIVIGRPGRAIPLAQAAQHIAGYTCFNDISNREAQYRDKQFFRGKSIDTGGPCGPWLVTPDELPPEALGLRITCRWNDVMMQDSNTDQLIFTPHAIVSYASRHMTLFPGDIIATGTPSGVGVFRDPPVFLKPGDVVEVGIEGLGTLTNPVVRW